jgi:hypothetical protein
VYGSSPANFQDSGRQMKIFRRRCYVKYITSLDSSGGTAAPTPLGGRAKRIGEPRCRVAPCNTATAPAGMAASNVGCVLAHAATSAGLRRPRALKLTRWEPKTCHAHTHLHGPPKYYRTVGRSQSVLIMINPIISPRTRRNPPGSLARNPPGWQVVGRTTTA